MSLYNGKREITVFVLSIILLIYVGDVTAETISACDYMSSINRKNITQVVVKREKEYKDVKKLNIGFNIELAQIDKSSGDYLNPKLVSLIRLFKPNSLRYPGGTPSNYFNWEHEILDEFAIDKYANKHIVKLKNRLKKENSGKQPRINLDSYSELIKQNDLRPFVVLNMFEPNEKIISAIDKVKKGLNKTIYWELGNEVFYKKHTNRILTSGNKWSKYQYIKKVQTITQYIKKNYSQDLVGISISDTAKWRNPVKKTTYSEVSYRNEWDYTLKKVSNMVDAVIIHPYIYSQEDTINNLKELNCINKQDDHVFYKTLWNISNITYLPKVYISRINKIFGDKPIWLTEIGLYEDWSESPVSDKKLKHDWNRVIDMTSLYISWLQQYPTVQTLLAHGLFEGFDWTHSIFPDGTLTSNGIAHRAVTDFIERVVSIAPITYTAMIKSRGIDRYSKMPLDFIYGLFGKTVRSNKNIAIIVNASSKAIEIEFPWFIDTVEEASHRQKERVDIKNIKSTNFYKKRKIESTNFNIKPLSIVLVHG
ncbi:MAG: hypothetical protein AB2552_02280 [Candidatus Thiodiazotropha endolucinida]